jgi:hypothetical protein
MNPAELAEAREINAHLPFADPIMPGYVYPRTGKYFTLNIESYRVRDRRRRALDRLHAFSRRHGFYDNDF